MKAFLGLTIISVSLFASLIPSSWASETIVPNDACKNAQVSSLHLQFSQGKFAWDQRDFCKIDLVGVPSEVRTVLAQIAHLHQKIATFFHLSPSELLPQGIAVSLNENALGSLDSDFSEGEIHLGVFSDWKGEDFDIPTYVHEFGHFLVHRVGGPLSAYAKQLASYGLYSEGLPDTLALAITGLVQGATGLPSCFSKATRELGSENSFLLDQEFFTGAHSTRAWGKCCEASPSSAHLNQACDEINPVVSKFSTSSSRPFFPRFCSTLPWDINGCSPHQLGTPVTSFLLDLQMDLHVDLQAGFGAYFEALSKAQSRPDARLVFSCRKNSTIVEVTEVAPDGALRLLREGLSKAGQADFDRLWKQHDLDSGMVVGREEARQQAVSDTSAIDCGLETR